MQIRVALAITLTSLAILIMHLGWPEKILLDQGTLAILALATLPWLTLFFKKFKIPGVGEAETQERVQGGTVASALERVEKAIDLFGEKTPDHF